MDNKMDRVSDWQKTVLAEDLVHDGWATGAAWQAAEDADNWEEDTAGNVRANVIATSDQYDTTWLTTAQAAVALGVSVQRVRAILKARPELGTKYGRDWLIKLSDLATIQDRKPGRPRK